MSKKARKKTVQRCPPSERVRDVGEQHQAAPMSLDDIEGSDGMFDPDYESAGHEMLESLDPGEPDRGPIPLDKIFRR